ncbi:hypothetical protein Tsubulata_008906 [Turnera subulata]|uniref:RNase H type-1 domain-containing protein n=1 Tax=Turnera subulata TaxID=218843 RepID=A0A9Q0J5K0_9ROSI|nr:hypothetical protein Tsubulata_008906 [Turnera subulata]
MLAIRLISQSLHIVHPLYALLFDIHELLARPWDCSIARVYREGNSCADFLAKFGVSQLSPVCIWSSPPDDLLPLLYSDVTGAATLRA